MNLRNNKDMCCMEGNNGRKELERTAQVLRNPSKPLSLRQHQHNPASTRHSSSGATHQRQSFWRSYL